RALEQGGARHQARSIHRPGQGKRAGLGDDGLVQVEEGCFHLLDPKPNQSPSLRVRARTSGEGKMDAQPTSGRPSMDVCLMIEGQENVTWEEWTSLALACEEHGFGALFRSD